MSGRGRQYAYLHESSPPNSPLISDKDAPVKNDVAPNYNSDKIPFVSLAQNGDKSGFHPSVDDKDSAIGRNIVARSMNVDDNDSEPPISPLIFDKDTEPVNIEFQDTQCSFKSVMPRYWSYVWILGGGNLSS